MREYTLRDHYQLMAQRREIHGSLDPRKGKPHGECGGTDRCGCGCVPCLNEAMRKKRSR
jgi:hypothetical protein